MWPNATVAVNPVLFQEGSNCLTETEFKFKVRRQQVGQIGNPVLFRVEYCKNKAEKDLEETAERLYNSFCNVDDKGKQKTPSLLISITGNAQPVYLNEQERKVIHTNLAIASHKGNAWITTGGTENGIMKEIGDMNAAFGFATTVIGFAAWKKVYHKDDLLPDDDSGVIRTYDNTKLAEAKKGELACLDPNHYHFVLVDQKDSNTPQWSEETPLREKFEARVCGGARRCEGKPWGKLVFQKGQQVTITKHNGNLKDQTATVQETDLNEYGRILVKCQDGQDRTYSQDELMPLDYKDGTECQQTLPGKVHNAQLHLRPVSPLP
jgi:hypothetical protein